MDNLNKYLPSKKFISILLIIVIFIALFFAIKGSILLIRKNKVAKQNGEITEVTVGSVIQKDSNNNGIADWEEYLWGLNPSKNGPENKELILSKKKTLTDNGLITMSDDSKDISDNEILSREFFATIMSLQQTGDLNEESIKSVSNAIGQKIEVMAIPNIYTENMLTIKADSLDAKVEYFGEFMNLVDKYKDRDIGKELTLISQGIGNNDQQALYAATTVSDAYRDFGRELIKIPVPKSASMFHLSLANNYEKTAQSIEGLTKVLTDPITGMRAIISYKKYNDALLSDIDKLSQVLK